MQGFFVKASSSPLTIPNTARVHDNNWLKNTETNPVDQLMLKLSNASFSDEAYIIFESVGSMNKGWYDADKFFSMDSKVPQVYTLKDNDQKICINSLPFIKDPLTVPLSVYIPSDGNYSLQLSGIESFPSLPGILLEDLITHATQNMVQTPVYAFSAAKADDPNRFVLHFAGTIGISEKPGNNAYIIFSSDNSLFVVDNTGKNQGDIYVYNMMGQLIASSGLNGNSSCKLNLNVPPGYYLIKVVASENAYSGKVFIK